MGSLDNVSPLLRSGAKSPAEPLRYTRNLLPLLPVFSELHTVGIPNAYRLLLFPAT